MKALIQQWHNTLATREAAHTYRRLTQYGPGIDFLSNDYLGLAKDRHFRQILLKAVNRQPGLLQGATGSRLISGNTAYTEATEAFIAAAHGTEAALFFASGYKANLALFSCILGRTDTIITDERVHRSVHDGCQLSMARKWKFRHNDPDHLETLLKKASGNIIIAIESLYSVDGNFAPIPEIIQLCRQYNAGLIVDEAHATGVFDKGLVHQYGLQNDVLATIVTYGKAMGLEGAAILGGQTLKNYLVNYAAPFIYSTAPSALHLLRIRAAYQYLAAQPQLRETLNRQIKLFRSFDLHTYSESGSPVQLVRFRDQAELRKVHQDLKAKDILTYPLFAPTVPQGAERLRICLHSFNTKEEINLLCTTIKNYAYVR